MSTRHTPGPWKVAAARRGYAIVDAHGNTIGAAHKLSHGYNSDPQPANARLIAAAPDLLAALLAMLDLHIAHHNHPTHGAARVAIARATGEAAE